MPWIGSWRSWCKMLLLNGGLDRKWRERGKEWRGEGVKGEVWKVSLFICLGRITGFVG